MTDKEKARAYDEAIKRAKALYDNNQPISGNNVIINNIFPELVESEDEKIRKAIIDGLREMKNSFHTISSIKIDDAIAWLEKQKLNNNVNLNEDVDRILEENDWDYDEIDFYEFAKHFYELGLKNTEGE